MNKGVHASRDRGKALIHISSTYLSPNQTIIYRTHPSFCPSTKSCLGWWVAEPTGPQCQSEGDEEVLKLTSAVRGLSCAQFHLWAESEELPLLNSAAEPWSSAHLEAWAEDRVAPKEQARSQLVAHLQPSQSLWFRPFMVPQTCCPRESWMSCV